MSKIAVTPGFCNHRTLDAGWAKLYPSKLNGWKHYFIDCHYPIRREENVRELRRICERYGADIIDAGQDWGAAKNFNRAIMPILRPDDFVAGVDPDATIHRDDSLDTAVVAMTAEPKLACLSLQVAGVVEQTVGASRSSAGVAWLEPGKPCMMDVTVWRGSFLIDVGGIRQQYNYYGQVEIPMFNAAKERGLTFGYLIGHGCDQDLRLTADREYVEWKAAHIGGFPGSFAEWLKESDRVPT